MKNIVTKLLMLIALTGCLCLTVFADSFLEDSSNACVNECSAAYEVCINECTSGNSNGGQPFCSANCTASYLEGLTYCYGLSYLGF